VPAEGVVLRINGLVHTSGDVPEPDEVRQLLERTGHTPLISESLSAKHPAIAALAPGFAGLLVIPLKSDGDTLVFFRREMARVVNWLGDPRSKNREGPLSPRVSFSAWRESVTGTALPWGRVAVEARDLGRELEGALLRRAEVALAGLAMRDALTGLHNRRSLLERLEPESTGSRALLFVDIDEFKAVNDTLGHDAGDRVIIEVAKRLLACSRADDLVVRLGGDEFVVLCEAPGPDEARAIADRVVAAVAKPIDLADGSVTVTASVGIVTATASTSGATLLEAADRAMYRAKKDGRNRVSE
jgi:diguanylate cyclase (GGDEF)-like protein